MARTVENVITNQIGQLVLQISTLIVENEGLREQVAILQTKTKVNEPEQTADVSVVK